MQGATANATVAVSGTGTATRTVTLSPITGDGTLGISIAAGTASDTAGNTAASAGPSTTFAVDNTAPGTPTVTSPATAVIVNTTPFAITGAAEANALVKVWTDGNNNGLKDDGQTTPVATQQLAGGATSYSVSTPLTTNAVNDFIVTATDAATNESAAADVPRITHDNVAPTTPATVFDGSVVGVDAAFTNSSTTLSANWTASVSGDVAGYEYGIGTSAGGTQVLGFTDVGNVTSVTKTGLSLTSGTTYFFTVRAYDGASNRSTVRNSNGIVVDTAAPTSSVTAPAAGASVNTLASISGTASDTGGSGVSF